MTEKERAQRAHDTCFALITAAITAAKTVDVEGMISQFIAETDDPEQALLDIAHTMVWHAAGALLTASDLDHEAALQLVQRAALTQQGATYAD